MCGEEHYLFTRGAGRACFFFFVSVGIRNFCWPVFASTRKSIIRLPPEFVKGQNGCQTESPTGKSPAKIIHIHMFVFRRSLLVIRRVRPASEGGLPLENQTISIMAVYVNGMCVRVSYLLDKRTQNTHRVWPGGAHTPHHKTSTLGARVSARTAHARQTTAVP